MNIGSLVEIFANEGRNRIQLLLGTDETTELATSVMFNLTTQVCGNGGCVTWVRKAPLEALPLVPSWDPRPTVAVLRRIEFVYLDGRAELVRFLNAMHSLGDVVDCLVIDGLQAYCDKHQRASFAGLLATADDLANWIGDRRPAGRCPVVSPPPVIVSCSLPESQHPALRTVAAIYTDHLIELKRIHNDNVEIHRNGKLCCSITVDSDKRIFQIQQTPTTTAHQFFHPMNDPSTN